jgi:23S rRNA (adenine2503-C2)-methyltransferase
MKSIRAIQKRELVEFLDLNNEKSFRANQVMDWLWKNRVSSFEEMTNLSNNLRKALQTSFYIDAATIDSIQDSSDGTIKVLFKLHDGLFVEGVIIPSENRVTACISSQVGCALGCKFCATGHWGFKRDLSVGEIYDQAFLLNKLSLEKFKLPLSNIVMMGMGEPLLNYENVMEGIRLITSDMGMGWANHRITLSTAGIPERIKQMADDGIKVNLALSLHSARKETRNELLPVSKKYTLDMLSEALKYYTNNTRLKVTIEYLLLNGVNDSAEDANELVRFCSRFASKINLIEYNPVSELPFQKSTPENTALFLKTLQAKNIISKIRKSRGKDIDAACGQLANKIKK